MWRTDCVFYGIHPETNSGFCFHKEVLAGGSLRCRDCKRFQLSDKDAAYEEGYQDGYDAALNMEEE